MHMTSSFVCVRSIVLIDLVVSHLLLALIGWPSSLESLVNHHISSPTTACIVAYSILDDRLIGNL